MSFVHLHNHSDYSILDSTSKIKAMIDRALQLDMKALAITDHGNLFGALEFYNSAKKAGIKPIIGMEANIAPCDRTIKKKSEDELYAYHLVLLAKNEIGFRNLIKLSSIAYKEGYYYRPRIDNTILRKYHKGLIAASACLKGVIPYKLKHSRDAEARKHAEEYRDIFGCDFYMEIQEHFIPDEQYTYSKVYQLANELGIKVIATNNNHYINKGDNQAHDILLCLQTGKDRDDPNRLRYKTEELYLKSAAEMEELFKDKPEALTNTLEIADKIELEIDFKQGHLPVFSIPKEMGINNPDEYLKLLTYRGAEKKYTVIDESVKARIEFELETIKKMGAADYFLVVQDFIDAAKKRDIPVGFGRGSAAGSIVNYSLDITNVDPLKYNLLFENFLNPLRPTMPDIDIDFCVERRGEVIDYVREKYGAENVTQIITFSTRSPKSVVYDVSRIIGMPFSLADYIATKIPMISAKKISVKKAFETVPELKKLIEQNDPKIVELIKYSTTLEGLIRHTSVHAAGVIIAPTDITNYVPVFLNSDKELVTQWTAGWSETIGMLKMDFLGLRNLTVIQNTKKLFCKRHTDFSFDRITLEDEKTFKLFGDGLTAAVFMFESSGMQDYLRKLKPSRIEDLIAMNALYRPGAMDMIDDFIDHKSGRKEIKYLHPKLEPILKETYGIIVYQEQVTRIANDLAGFSLAQADLMRRAMGKKNPKIMAEQKEIFIEGCLKNGIDKKAAYEVADLMEKFAEYGFNKSHSAAYAIIAYQTAYLKAHYPAEFYKANLLDATQNKERLKILREECEKLGIYG